MAKAKNYHRKDKPHPVDFQELKAPLLRACNKLERSIPYIVRKAVNEWLKKYCPELLDEEKKDDVTSELTPADWLRAKHISDKTHSSKCKIISQLIAKGLKPKLEAIDIVNDNDAKSKEDFYIDLFKKFKIGQLEQKNKSNYFNQEDFVEAEVTTVRLEPENKQWILDKARKENRTFNNMLNKILKDVMNKEDILSLDMIKPHE